MAEIQLTRKEEKGALPDLCMCCGEQATAWVERTFMLRDPTVAGPSGFLEVFVVRLALAAASTPRLRLRTSFCSQHRHYWGLRSALLVGGLAGLLAAFIFGIASVVFLLKVQKVDAPWLSCCVICPVFTVMIPWGICTKIAVNGTIRTRLTRLIGDEVVVLQNVDERYVAAVQAARKEKQGEPG